ncbi:hypothetical protein [Catenulispora pinisilvae]|uniref:hypothetical protein n=1 Tax=Catenulispora pinisilvae TaxID=2705253 RepID=UPI00189118DD|nr:hypothetical protein [Catenulispora pinisilvae]
MNAVPEYRALLAVDVEGSSGRGNPALMTVRRTLAQALAESVERSGIVWERCLREDLGDGIRLIAPEGASRAAFIHPLIVELGARLRAHNRYAGFSTRIRLRVAVHAGDVIVGPDGAQAGASLAVLARMLDARASREALKREPETTPLVLLISDHVYEETVRHGYPGMDPGEFESVEIAEKEYTARGWLHVPGRRARQAVDNADSAEAVDARDSRPNAAPNAVPSAAPDAVSSAAPDTSVMIVEAHDRAQAHGVGSGTMNIHYHGDE